MLLINMLIFQVTGIIYTKWQNVTIVIVMLYINNTHLRCKQIVYCKHPVLIAGAPQQFFIIILLKRLRVIKEGCLSGSGF